MKKNDNESRVVILQLDVAECEHGNQHIVGAEVLADSATVYEAPDTGRTCSIGWRRSATLDANWEATFGPRKRGPVN